MSLVAPHGGKLVNRILEPSAAQSATKEAASLPSLTLSPREQFVVGADFDDTAVNDDDDAVGAAHRRQPMRDHERRAVGHQMFERFLHRALGGRVQ